MKLQIGMTMGLMTACLALSAPSKPGAKPKPNTLITSLTMELDYSKPQMVSVHRGKVKVVDREIDLVCDILTVTFAGKKKKVFPSSAITKPIIPPKPIVIGDPPKGGVAKRPPVPPMIGVGGNIETIIADGNVVIYNKKDKTRAVGKKAVYTSATEQVVLTGNPVLYTENSTVKGTLIILDRRTNKLSVKDPVEIVEAEEKKKPKPTPPAPSKR